ncbi:MAG: argininosuccinate lyase [Syntrophales bacterium]
MVNREKPWGGRFLGQTDKEVEAFTASIHFDKRLYRYDIQGSIAHARMLAEQGILSAEEGETIVCALEKISVDMDEGIFEFRPDDEDIHMAIEKALIDRVGDTGGKLHTARSRNDQVTLDMRLYLREENRQIIELLGQLKQTLLKLAQKEIKTIMPGYTHMQKAQPVLLAHYLMAFWEMFARDEARLRDSEKRIAVMPLGAAALAGTGLPIDRDYTARLLAFPAISQNSMDAVSDRDFIVEFIADASLVMMHMSRFAEDLILWATEEFAFVAIDDTFTTGSSIMPQKKNPDVAELLRGKTARIYGNLMALLTLLKGLPMTYNRDLQEDKEPLFDTVDTVKSCLHIFTAMIGRLTFNRLKMRRDAKGGFSIATDVAEYLVKKGVPFRTAHGVVGKLVAYCIQENKTIESLTLAEFKSFHIKFGRDLHKILTVDSAVKVRDITGGTSGRTVRKRLRELEKLQKERGDVI